MIITILTSTPPIKGISKYSSALIQSLADRCEVEVLSFKSIYPEKLYPGGTKDPSLNQLKQTAGLQIRNFLTWYNPFGWIYAGVTLKGEVLHVQWWTYVLAPIYATIMLIAKIRGKNIVVTMHNVKPHEGGTLKNWANKIVASLADSYIVHTDEGKKDFLKLYKKPEDRIDVIPHGILMPDAPMRNLTKIEARHLLKIPGDKKVLLFFGIIREYKGLDVLIRALAIIKKTVPNAYLVVAGKPWEDWSKYENLVIKSNLKDSIRTDLRFVSEDDIEGYFQASDVVVLPYIHFDAQSGAGTLALPFGKAMVVTDVGGLPSLVLNKNAITRAGDSNDLAKKIISILCDPKLKNTLELDSLKLAKKLSWNSIAKQTKEVYVRITRQ